MVENWRAVAESIERLRKERGWTQIELGERSGVSAATIRNAEHVVGKRSRRTMEDLSRAFGLPRDYLNEILTGHPATELAPIEQPQAETGPQAFLSMLDRLLVKRLTELVVPHLNQIERQLHVTRHTEITTEPSPRTGEL
jgi:transcriptional regulator with XRE-family HTH domain